MKIFVETVSGGKSKVKLANRIRITGYETIREEKFYTPEGPRTVVAIQRLMSLAFPDPLAALRNPPKQKSLKSNTPPPSPPDYPQAAFHVRTAIINF